MKCEMGQAEETPGEAASGGFRPLGDLRPAVGWELGNVFDNQKLRDFVVGCPFSRASEEVWGGK